MTITRFIWSWIAAALAMLMLSYVWHGLILNDFRNLSLSLPHFLGLSVVAYFFISAILNIVLHYIMVEEVAITKGVLVGAAFGFFLYLAVYTLGLAYHARGMKHLVIDFVWQMIEQGAGAFVIGFAFRIYERNDAMRTSED